MRNLDPATLPKPYSNIQGAHLENRDALYYLVSTLWKKLEIPGTVPPPFNEKDLAIIGFNGSLKIWAVSSNIQDLQDQQSLQQ